MPNRNETTIMSTNKCSDDEGEVGSFSLIGVQIAVQICCVLGQKEMFDYFLTELPIPVNLLTTPNSAELFLNKGISFPFTGNNFIVRLGPIEIVMMVNQHEFLGHLLPHIKAHRFITMTDPPLCSSRGIMEFLFSSRLRRLQTSSITENKHSYMIEPISSLLIDWLELAVQFDAYECAFILMSYFPSKIAEALNLAKCTRRSRKDLTRAVTILQHAFMLGSRMFALFESLEAILLPVLVLNKLLMRDSAHSYTTPYMSLDFDFIFSQVEKSLQYIATRAERENHDRTAQAGNRKQSSSKVNSKDERWSELGRILRCNLLHIVMGCTAPFEMLHAALQQNESNIWWGAELKNYRLNYSALQEMFLPSMLSGFVKLFQFEYAHPAIWLHANLQNGSSYRIPPSGFLFAVGLRKLFYNSISFQSDRNVYLLLLMLLSFVIEQHSKSSRTEKGNLLAYICCSPYYDNRDVLCSSDYFPFYDSAKMVSASLPLLDDLQCIEYCNHCISLCRMAYKAWQSFPNGNTGLTIDEFDDFKCKNISTHPIGCLNQINHNSDILDKVRNSLQWTDRFIQKIIVPFCYDPRQPA